ncbi:hypothetical protein DTO271D3_2540 [Paecilomyces variotii]|nr:hypothetical protein DTO207G8_4521 [Paecilomyces variotii]KAJ9289135.1 hypothetical protein DTO021C3_3327 [Paecilomyces variotii]KAJ9317250.1 hypothetical protein DTO271D3_2540 [Paecilomyces variotii]KAJ9364156.1 hypothetical protein DTO280E4_1919 [Paecilomyces variotii]KAJ9396446.1 hypothetical protein DTO282F9_6581 [Paecilomyces variotii]
MSSEPQPITPAAFAEALKALPLSAVYAKVSEIRNSIAHLHRSNAELKLFIEESTETESDKRELESYISENEGVIETMNERVELCKAEVEERGQQWIELDADTEEQGTVAAEGEEASTADSAAAHASGVNGINGTGGSGIEGGEARVGGASAATTNGTSSQQSMPATGQQDVETEEEGGELDPASKDHAASQYRALMQTSGLNVIDTGSP